MTNQDTSNRPSSEAESAGIRLLGGEELHWVVGGVLSVSFVFAEFKETSKLQQDTGGDSGSTEFGR
jgi:hypothetical protein